jgi:radical SAM-linked protein
MNAPAHASAPIVQRLRLRYSRTGRLRFASHRDFQRVFERAIRRAGVPIAFSQGFNPHPRISYAGAAPTGAASVAEYLEMGLTVHCDPAKVMAALNAALPADMAVLDIVEGRVGALAERLEVGFWRLELPEVTAAAAEKAVSAFLAAPEVLVERLTKDGKRTLDARAAVISLRVESLELVPEIGPCAILDLVVRNGSPSVRPDDVLAALRLVGDLVPPVTPRATRLAQGPLEADGAVADPLGPDRTEVLAEA